MPTIVAEFVVRNELQRPITFSDFTPRSWTSDLSVLEAHNPQAVTGKWDLPSWKEVVLSRGILRPMMDAFEAEVAFEIPENAQIDAWKAKLYRTRVEGSPVTLQLSHGSMDSTIKESFGKELAEEVVGRTYKVIRGNLPWQTVPLPHLCGSTAFKYTALVRVISTNAMEMYSDGH